MQCQHQEHDASHHPECDGGDEGAPEAPGKVGADRDVAAGWRRGRGRLDQECAGTGDPQGQRRGVRAAAAADAERTPIAGDAPDRRGPRQWPHHDAEVRNRPGRSPRPFVIDHIGSAVGEGDLPRPGQRHPLQRVGLPVEHEHPGAEPDHPRGGDRPGHHVPAARSPPPYSRRRTRCRGVRVRPAARRAHQSGHDRLPLPNPDVPRCPEANGAEGP